MGRSEVSTETPMLLKVILSDVFSFLPPVSVVSVFAVFVCVRSIILRACVHFAATSRRSLTEWMVELISPQTSVDGMGLTWSECVRCGCCVPCCCSLRTH